MSMSRAFLFTAVMLLAGCASRKPAPPMPLPELSEVREFVVPWENAYPNDVAIDSIGRLWFTDRLTHAIGMFDPKTEQFTRHELPGKRGAPYGIVTAADGGIWFAESVAQSIARIDPATGAIVEHRLEGSTKGPNLMALHNGVLWFSLRDEAAYGSYDIARGTARLYKAQRARPYGIAITPDGTIWFGGGGGLHAVDPRTGEAQRHDVTANVPIPENFARSQLDSVRRVLAARNFLGEVRRMAADRAGNVWFTDYQRGQVLRYTPATGTLTTFPSLQRNAQPYGITVSSHGHVWYGEAGTGEVVVLDPLTEERRRARVPTKGAVVRHLIVDEARQRVWLPLSEVGRIGLIELSCPGVCGRIAR